MLVSRSKASTRRGGKHTGERFAAEAEGILERGEHMAAEVAGRAGKAASSALHSASEAVGSAVHGIEDATERSGGAIKSFAKGAGDTAARVAKGAGNMYDQAADGVRRGAERIGKSYGSGLKEHPLLLVGAALALGAVFGFVLPRTQRENSLMGPSRDRLLAGAKSGVQEAAGSLARRAATIISRRNCLI